MVKAEVIFGIAIVAMVAAGSYAKGRHDEKTAQLLEINRLTVQAHNAEEARMKTERALYQLREKLNAQALEDPLANNPSLGVDSLRRLNQFD